MRYLKNCWWLVLLLLLCMPQLSFAAEYSVTEEELTQLENSLEELSSLNRSQSLTLEKQKEQLTLSIGKLEKAEQQSGLLLNQLKLLEEKLTEQEQSLQDARTSYEAFELEAQNKEKQLKQEKTVAWVIAGILLCCYIGK